MTELPPQPRLLIRQPKASPSAVLAFDAESGEAVELPRDLMRYATHKMNLRQPRHELRLNSLGYSVSDVDLLMSLDEPAAIEAQNAAAVAKHADKLQAYLAEHPIAAAHYAQQPDDIGPKFVLSEGLAMLALAGPYVPQGPKTQAESGDIGL